MNIEEVAGHFKVHPGTVRGWIRKGLPVVSPGGRGRGYVLDLGRVSEWHRVHILKNLTFDEVWENFNWDLQLQELAK
jgi:hypothetical protein